MWGRSEFAENANIGDGSEIADERGEEPGANEQFGEDRHAKCGADGTPGFGAFGVVPEKPEERGVDEGHIHAGRCGQAEEDASLNISACATVPGGAINGHEAK